MKKLISVLILLIFCINTQAQKDINHYLVKSGYVEYELTGSIKGVKKIWWDDYGDKEREEIQ